MAAFACTEERAVPYPDSAAQCLKQWIVLHRASEISLWAILTMK